MTPPTARASTSAAKSKSALHQSPGLQSPDTWDHAIEHLAALRPVVVAGPDCTALVYAAWSITTAQMADLIRRSSGFVQVILPQQRCDELLLPEAAPTNRDPGRAAFGQCVGVDAATAITTGISATDRARTARILCSPTTVATDLTRPGHVIPVRADPELDPQAPRHSMPTLILALTQQSQPTPGAAFAELVSEHDPLHRVSPNEAREIAAQLGTVVVCM